MVRATNWYQGLPLKQQTWFAAAIIGFLLLAPRCGVGGRQQKSARSWERKGWWGPEGLGSKVVGDTGALSLEAREGWGTKRVGGNFQGLQGIH